MPPVYHYRSLEEGWIRLFRIKTSDTRDLACDIFTVPLSSAGPYSALSYVWGDPKKVRDIFISERRLQIPATLYEFLKQLRSSGQEAWLWADSICINQRYVAERNAQVQMMAGIYSNATHVLAWLGEAADDSDYAFHAIKHLPAEHISQHDSERLMKALNNICNREYWFRTWIVQEFVLARSIRLFCGSSAIPHSCIAFALDRMASVEGYYPSSLELTSNYSKFMAMRHQRVQEGGKLLRDIFKTVSGLHLKSSDLRDQVYAMRGIAKDGTALRVDYSQNTAQLFFEVLRFCQDPSLSSELSELLLLSPEVLESDLKWDISGLSSFPAAYVGTILRVKSVVKAIRGEAKHRDERVQACSVAAVPITSEPILSTLSSEITLFGVTREDIFPYDRLYNFFGDPRKAIIVRGNGTASKTVGRAELYLPDDMVEMILHDDPEDDESDQVEAAINPEAFHSFLQRSQHHLVDALCSEHPRMPTAEIFLNRDGLREVSRALYERDPIMLPSAAEVWKSGHHMNHWVDCNGDHLPRNQPDAFVTFLISRHAQMPRSMVIDYRQCRKSPGWIDVFNAIAWVLLRLIFRFAHKVLVIYSRWKSQRVEELLQAMEQVLD